MYLRAGVTPPGALVNGKVVYRQTPAEMAAALPDVKDLHRLEGNGLG